MARTDTSIHGISRVELTLEQVGPLGATLCLDFGESELSLFFPRTRAGLTAWQQVRQGLPRAGDCTTKINGEIIEPRSIERQLSEWLLASGGHLNGAERA